MSAPITVLAQNSVENKVVVKNQLINLNTADQKALELLPGIGKSKAAAIVLYRDNNGHFKSINDLKKVQGLGKKAIAKLEGKVRF
jgi:competence protein ComEA